MGVLQPIDWAILGGYILLSIIVGILVSRRGRMSTSEYFKSGGGSPWWLLGTSMAATTFAADTPLALAGFVVVSGISKNWFWWCQVPVTLAGVFFFARLWRRANPLTDMELVHLRYSGRSANVLRGFKAVWLAIPYGCLVMGWVNKAMTKIIVLCIPDFPPLPGIDSLMLWLFLATPLSEDVDPSIQRACRENQLQPLAISREYGLMQYRHSRLFEQLEHLEREADHDAFFDRLDLEQSQRRQAESMAARYSISPVQYLGNIHAIAAGVLTYKVLFLLFLITVAYTAISGLWGVMITDFIQFWIAMAGCLYLAFVAVDACGGLNTLLLRMGEVYGAEKARAMTAILPTSSASDLGLMPFGEFLIFICLAWWTVGFTDGGSYLAQRMLAAKDERHAALGYLWYGVAHYALRMWPWLVIGMAASVLFPYLPYPDGVMPGKDVAENGFIHVMISLLKPGMLGLLLAAFLAAYMSTISTQVNVAASYLMNDFYRPFLAPAIMRRTGRQFGEKHFVRIGILLTLVVAVIGLAVSLMLNSISGAWFLLAAFNSGIGAIYLLRWYWWRVNAWTEFSCILALFYAAAAFKLFEGKFDWFEGLPYPYNLLITAPFAVGVAILVTLMTRPTDRNKLKAFCRKVQPGGPGWKEIEQEIQAEEPSFRQNSPLQASNFVKWIMSVASIYCFLYGTGRLILGNTLQSGLMSCRFTGLVFVIIGLSLGFAVARTFSSRRWKESG